MLPTGNLMTCPPQARITACSSAHLLTKCRSAKALWAAGSACAGPAPLWLAMRCCSCCAACSMASDVCGDDVASSVVSSVAGPSGQPALSEESWQARARASWSAPVVRWQCCQRSAGEREMPVHAYSTVPVATRVTCPWLLGCCGTQPTAVGCPYAEQDTQQDQALQSRSRAFRSIEAASIHS